MSADLFAVSAGLSCGSAFWLEIAECFAVFRQVLEQRRGFPKRTEVLVELGNAFVDFVESNAVGIPHRAATIGWESIAVYIDDVQIGGAQGIALLEDARAFIHRRINAAVHDFLRRNFALWDAGPGAPPANERRDFGIGFSTALGVVFIPAATRLLTETPHFAQLVFQERLALVGILQVTMLLADAPANVETGQVSSTRGP
jgi:hypothetical protein